MEETRTWRMTHRMLTSQPSFLLFFNFQLKHPKQFGCGEFELTWQKIRFIFFQARGQKDRMKIWNKNLLDKNTCTAWVHGSYLALLSLPELWTFILSCVLGISLPLEKPRCFLESYLLLSLSLFSLFFSLFLILPILNTFNKICFYFKKKKELKKKKVCVLS